MEKPHIPPEPQSPSTTLLEAAALAPASAYPTQRTLARWLLVAAGIWVVGWLLWSAAPVMLPFIIGLVLAYLLTPIVNWLGRWMPRWVAILIVFAVGLGLIIGLVAFVVPLVASQIAQLIDNLPSLNTLPTTFDQLLAWYTVNVPSVLRDPFDSAIQSALQTLQANLANYVRTVGTFLIDQVLGLVNLITFLVGFLIIPFWLFYVLNDSAKGARAINRLLHARLRSDFWNVWRLIDDALSDYIRGQLLLGLAVGLAVGVGLLLIELFGLHVRYILLLAIIAGITELIPYLGPILGAIPAVLIALFSADRPFETTLAVLVVYVVVQQLENNLLVPRIVGDSVGLHPAILTVLIIAMGYNFGLLGVVLAPPIGAAARDLFLYTYRRLSGGAPREVYLSVAKTGPVRAKPAAPTPREDEAAAAP